MKRILIIVMSCGIMPKDKPTRIWLEEYVVPYQLLIQEGWNGAY